MRITIGIDPGKNNTGIAILKDGLLLKAALALVPKEKGYDPTPVNIGRLATLATNVAYHIGDGLLLADLWGVSAITNITFEWPQVYAGAAGHKEDPNDLLPLAGLDGAVCALLKASAPLADDRIHTVNPRTWKGQVPKEIMLKRIVDHLTPDEQAVLDHVQCPPALKHNVIDAIGIAKWADAREAHKTPSTKA